MVLAIFESLRLEMELLAIRDLKQPSAWSTGVTFSTTRSTKRWPTANPLGLPGGSELHPSYQALCKHRKGMRIIVESILDSTA
jgi:hypothetical protein